MIDIHDLKELQICKKCNHVYMPEMQVDPTDYYKIPYAINTKLCANCVEGVV